MDDGYRFNYKYTETTDEYPEDGPKCLTEDPSLLTVANMTKALPPIEKGEELSVDILKEQLKTDYLREVNEGLREAVKYNQGLVEEYHVKINLQYKEIDRLTIENAGLRVGREGYKEALFLS